MFVLYLRKFYIIKYILYKNIWMECGESLYKKVACLHHVISISQHFDWLFCITRNVIGRIIFKVMTSQLLKKKFEYALWNSKNSK